MLQPHECEHFFAARRYTQDPTSFPSSLPTSGHGQLQLMREWHSTRRHTRRRRRRRAGASKRVAGNPGKVGATQLHILGGHA